DRQGDLAADAAAPVAATARDCAARGAAPNIRAPRRELERPMQLQLQDEGEGVLNLAPVGRRDPPGGDLTETRLAAHTRPRGGNPMIDVSQVSFIGSGGIRMFITIARALGRKNSKLVLYGAQPLVAQVFETTSLNQIVPVRSDATAAVAVVRG